MILRFRRVPGQRDPKNDQIKGDLIRVEADIGGMRAGLAKARAFAGEDPGNPLYDIVSASLFEKAGRRDNAFDLLEKAIAAKPSTDALITALSGLYIRTGEPGKAEAVLSTRLQADPKAVAIRSDLASLYLVKKKYDEAIVEFKRALDLDAHNSHALFRMAEAQSKLGNLSAALNTLKAAVEGDRQPKWTEVWAYVNIGRIYDIRGQRYRAIPMYRQAVDTGDDSFSAQAEAKKCLDKPCEGRILTWPSP